jgi:TolB-like protein
MRYLTLVLCALTCLCAPSAHAQRGADAFDAELARIAGTFARSTSGRTVAVFEFPDLESRITNLGRLVSEQLTTELVQQTQGRASVVERRQVIQVLTELNLLNTDLTSSQVARVGRMLGADAIVLGSATVLGSQVVVNARLVDVSAGRVLAADRMRVEASDPLLAMAQQGLNAPSLTPAPRPPGSAPAPHNPLASARRETIGQTSVELVACTGRSTSVTCDLRFRNEGPDASLTLSAHERTRIIDEAGTEYRSSMLELAGEQRNARVYKTLVHRITTAGRVTYSPVPQTLRTIPLLEIRVYHNGDHVLQFRDVPITR